MGHRGFGACPPRHGTAAPDQTGNRSKNRAPLLQRGVDPEAAARAIADEAKRTRERPSRGLWVAAIVVSIVCLGALAIGWFEARDVPAVAHPAHVAEPTSGGGFGLGLGVGIAAGIVIGSLLARRRPK